MYTWRDIKLATLQKMFAADGSEIVIDESTQDYIAGMPYAANEALMRLQTAGKFLVKSIVLNHMPANNLVSTKNLIDARDYKLTVDGGKSIYLQYSGIGSVEITGGDYESPMTKDFDSYGTFTESKGNLNNASGGKVTFHFTSDYPATIKNLAVYDTFFPDDESIPPYGDFVKYDLKTLCDDFYNLFDNSIVYEGDNPTYLNTTDYYRESDHILILPKTMPGMYTIYYHAYPQSLTIETEDDAEIAVDPEVAVLMPLYMAAELYKDDDNGIATTYRNEFEVGLESLINTSYQAGKEKFISEWV